MTTVTDAWAMAITHLQAGRHNEAAQICQQIVAIQPDFADAWHLLGVIALQTGQLEGAIHSLERAVRANPADAEAFSNLGIARKSVGQWDDAIECFRSAVALRPDFAEAHYNLAHALHERGRIDEAINGYRRALGLKPADAVIHNNLANALRDKGNVEEAIASYQRAIDLQPTYAEAHYNLGNVYQQANRDEEAIACFRRAIELNPNYAEAYSNLGTVFQKRDDSERAIACYKQALELGPNSAIVHFNLGSGWHQHGDLGKAIEHYQRAIALKPDDARANSSLGSALYDSGSLDEAIPWLKRAIELQPDFANAHCGFATALLKRGDLIAGFSEYEWRWKAGVLRPVSFPQPRWSGEPLAGKTILLSAEQGFGDTLQFIRYASIVKGLGATVVVECPDRLMKVLMNYTGIDRLVRSGDELPSFDVHSPLLSLAATFKTSLETIPRNVPYLFADQSLVDYWRERLRDVQGFRIGINWHGRVGQGTFLQRDIPLDCFASLSEVAGVQLISLQKGVLDEQAGASARLPILDVGDDFDDSRGPFMDTAAILKNLDLVISSDTSVAHLAGALGVPVWLALPRVADWRWLLDRDDSPWYPTMRLFRQNILGDWNSVFDEIGRELCKLMAGAR